MDPTRARPDAVRRQSHEDSRFLAFQPVEEIARRDQANAFVFPQVEEMAVAGDDVLREALDGGRDVDVVCRVGLDDTAGDASLDDDGDRSQRFDPEVEVLVREGQVLSDSGIAEAAAEFLEGCA